jgi:hypothetical protein
MDQLREEIMEAQQARADLLKWKLVIVAAVGGVGLGLSTSTPASPLVLILIPLACFYVDLLCQHLNLRIQLIAQFMRLVGYPNDDKDSPLMSKYERYVLIMARSPEDVFRLESWALRWSTLALSALVGLYGVWLAIAGPEAAVGAALIGFGAAGIPLANVTDRLYSERRTRIELSGLSGPLAEEALTHAPKGKRRRR